MCTKQPRVDSNRHIGPIDQRDPSIQRTSSHDAEVVNRRTTSQMCRRDRRLQRHRIAGESGRCQKQQDAPPVLACGQRFQVGLSVRDTELTGNRYARRVQAANDALEGWFRSLYVKRLPDPILGQNFRYSSKISENVLAVLANRLDLVSHHGTCNSCMPPQVHAATGLPAAPQGRSFDAQASRSPIASIISSNLRRASSAA